MKLDTIIFDLDGTLIDSAASIISSVEAAFKDTGIEQRIPITAKLIGPPLEEIMRTLVTDSDIKAIPRLLEAFKCHYDEIGFKETIVYEGIIETLLEFKQNGINLYIATNKRKLAANKILHHLGWTNLFMNLFTLDSFAPPLPNKNSMLKIISSTLPGKIENRIYIGDRQEDADAAKVNNLYFLWAKWGYGGLDKSIDDYAALNKPDDLKKILIYTQDTHGGEERSGSVYLNSFSPIDESSRQVQH